MTDCGEVNPCVIKVFLERGLLLIEIDCQKRRVVSMHYSRTARYYYWLEVLSFGTALRSARLAHLDRIQEQGVVRRALLIGEGNGSFLIPFLRRYTEVNVTVVDESVEMLDVARARLGAAGLSADRVQFVQADVCQHRWPERTYDLIVTHFFFDNFNDEAVAAMVASLAMAGTEDAQWLLADFSIPERGWRKWRAKLWLQTLYAFFGRTAGVECDQLPEMEQVLVASGFVPVAHDTRCGGLLSSTYFRKALIF
jgi:ubiquinone/menaquinone biosynthesis C-methylase UbiE